MARAPPRGKGLEPASFARLRLGRASHRQRNGRRRARPGPAVSRHRPIARANNLSAASPRPMPAEQEIPPATARKHANAWPAIHMREELDEEIWANQFARSRAGVEFLVIATHATGDTEH